jgi:hypothetical protein
MTAFIVSQNTDKPGYNDIGLYDISATASDILWYQLIPRCYHKFLILGYNSRLWPKLFSPFHDVITECIC